MSIPRIENLGDLRGAPVLLRLDLNVPVTGGEVQDASRVEAAMPTVEELLESGAVVVACSHLGKPKGERRPEAPGSTSSPAPGIARPASRWTAPAR